MSGRQMMVLSPGCNSGAFVWPVWTNTPINTDTTTTNISCSVYSNNTYPASQREMERCVAEGWEKLEVGLAGNVASESPPTSRQFYQANITISHLAAAPRTVKGCRSLLTLSGGVSCLSPGKCHLLALNTS